MAVTKKPASKRLKKLPIRVDKKPKQAVTKMSRSRNFITKNRLRLDDYLSRRPHRSLRRTRRRDYVRSLKLPGYVAFTHSVVALLWKHRATVLLLAGLYVLLNAILVGIGSQSTYTTLSDTLKHTSGNIFSGGVGQVSQAGLLLLASLGGNLNSSSVTDAQKIFGFLLGLMLWLTMVWLVRAYAANQRPRLRDALYNSSSPLISMFLVALFGVIQLIPLALAIIGFAATSNYGLMDGGLPAMLFSILALLLVSLSLYWVTSTFLALVIVTLPGMYPWRAIKTAGDLVIGRRVRILLRLLWLGLVVVIGWAVVMIPVILFANWIGDVWKQISWLPIVPIFLLLMSTLTLIFASTYIYLLYRKVVDDDAKPA